MSVLSLGEALPLEVARVRDEILPVYDKTPGGEFAAAMMRADLDKASKAMIEQDLPAMIEVYKSLRGWEL